MLTARTARFLKDQRTCRTMLLPGPVVELRPCPVSVARKGRPRAPEEPQNSSAVNPISNDFTGLTLRSRNLEYSNERNAKSYNMLKMGEVGRVAERYGVSNTATAAIASATLSAAGLIKEDDKQLVCDRSKIRRCRVKEREKQLENLDFEGIRAIYFDGRIDDTLTIRNGARRMIKEDQIAFVQQPGSFFMGHKTVLTTSAPETVTAINQIMKDTSVSPDDIDYLGSDGTPGNTGQHAGAIRLFEEEHGKSVQWSICMLHLNELPLRALIEKMDGPFKSKNTLSGPIGTRLNTCEALPVADLFIPVHFPVPAEMDMDDLKMSTD